MAPDTLVPKPVVVGSERSSPQRPMATKRSRIIEELEQLYTAFNQGDIETVVNAMTDDITWMEAEGEPYGGTYRGPDEVLQMSKRIPEDFDHYAVTPSR